MPNPQVGLDIVASDKTKKGFDSAEKRAKTLGQNVGKSLKPVEKIGQSSQTKGFLRTLVDIEKAAAHAFGAHSLIRLNRHAHAFRELGSAVGSGFGRVSVAANDAGEAIGGVAAAGEGAGVSLGEMAAGGLAAGAGLGGAAAAGTALVAALGPVAVIGAAAIAVLAAGAVAGYKFAAGWAAAAASLGRLSETIGITSRNMQELQGAGERYGISKDATAGAIGSFATTVHDARFGRNNEALALMSKMGVGFKYKKDGTLDYDRMMLSLADAIKRQKDPQTELMLANRFGVTAMLPMLRKGSKAVMADEADVGRNAFIASNKDIANAQSFVRNSTRLGQLANKSLLNPLSDANRARVAGLYASPTERIADALSDSGKKFSDSSDVFSAAVDKFAGGGFSGRAAGVASDIASGNIGSIRRVPGGTTAVGRFASRLWGNVASGVTQARDWFVKQGWSAAQASGIVASLQTESGLNPHGRPGDSGLAVGIAQWHPPRQAQFKRLFGHDVRQGTYAEQLAFVQWELTHGRGGNHLIRARTAAEAGAIVSRYYESPKDREGEMRRRGRLAEQVAALPSQTVTHVHEFHGLPYGTKVTTRTKGTNAVAISHAMANASDSWNG